MAAMLALAFLERAGRLGIDAGRRGVDAVLPPRCLACGTIVLQQDGLCASCWPGLDFISTPRCACCGLPFDWDHGLEALCAGCIAQPPAFERARAALRYNDTIAQLLVGFKRGDRLHHLDVLVRWLRLAGGEALAEAEIVCPVPLHWRRLWWRRFNQSALLANALARRTGLVAMPDLLVRRRATPSQHGLDRRQRIANLRGAIAVRERRVAAVEGRHVLLIDDVMTSGATVGACTVALKRAGAGRVDAAVVARAVS